MVARRRLDAELVRRKMARSRDHAVEMIRGGRVLVGGMRAVKPATVVDGEESIRVIEGESDDWASRGAHKLLGAVEAFEPFGIIRLELKTQPKHLNNNPLDYLPVLCQAHHRLY